MARQTLQANFTGGELSSALGARVDLKEYNTAAKTLKNVFCHIQGGISNRAGTQYLANFADTAHAFKRFQFSVEQAYGLVFTNLRMYILKDGGIVSIDLVESGTYKWSASGSGTDEYYMELDAGGDPGIGQVYVLFEDNVKIPEGTAGSLSAGEWDWGDNDTLGYDTVYVRLTDGADPDSKADGYLFNHVAYATPWLTADLAELRFNQSADVLYTYHPDYSPREIARTSHTDWTITETEYVEDPYADRTQDNEDDTMVIDGHLGDGRSVVCSKADTFTSDMVGRTMRLGYQNAVSPDVVDWSTIRIASYVSGTEVTGDIVGFAGSNYLTNWDFSNGVSPWYQESSLSTTDLTWDQTNSALVLEALGAVCEARTSVTVAEYTSYLMKVKSGTIDSGTVTIKIGTTAGASDLLSYSLAASTEYSEEFKVENNTTIYLTIVTSATSATANIDYLGIFGGTTLSATKLWRVPAMQGTGYYPGVSTFFEQRLVLAGADETPQTVSHSKTGGYYDFGFSTPLVDDDTIKYTLASNSADGIRWLVPLRELLIGTSDGVWKVSRGKQTSSMTPLSVDAKKKYEIGCEKIEPVVLGTSVLYIERGATRVEQVTYALESDEFTGFNITDTAAHLFEGKQIVDWAYARTPYSLIYCVLDDGNMAVLTIDINRKIYAWQHYETEGNYKNVVSVPGDTREDVYFVVERTVDGADKYYTEHLQPRITDKTTGDWWFVDSGLKYDGVSTSTVSGLDHLEGEVVKILADGGVQTDKTVASGQITLDEAAELIIVGLGYDQEIETLDLDLTPEGGTSQGRLKNVSKVTFKVVDSRGFFVGTDTDYMEEPRLTTQEQGEGLIPPYTGIWEIPIDSEFENDLSVIVQNSQPIPLTILSIIPDIQAPENEDNLQQ